jgi:hypothetical protein
VLFTVGKMSSQGATTNDEREELANMSVQIFSIAKWLSTAGFFDSSTSSTKKKSRADGSEKSRCSTSVDHIRVGERFVCVESKLNEPPAAGTRTEETSKPAAPKPSGRFAIHPVGLRGIGQMGWCVVSLQIG